MIGMMIIILRLPDIGVLEYVKYPDFANEIISYNTQISVTSSKFF